MKMRLAAKSIIFQTAGPHFIAGHALWLNGMLWKMDRQEAEGKGYTPCMICGGRIG